MLVNGTCRSRAFAASLVAVLACASLAPATASAQDTTAADEVVVLKNGSAFRGQLVEKVPNAHVTIKLANGEVRRFEWNDVARASTAPLAATSVTRSAPDGPRVTIESDDPQTSLFHMNESGNIEGYAAGRSYHGGFESWRSACVAPCNAPLDPRLTYRVAGIGITPSGSFVLPQGKESVTLRVRTGSMWWHGTGSSLTWTGLSVAILGGIVAGLSYAVSPPLPGEPDIQGGMRTGGFIALGVGGGMMIIGIPMMLLTGTTVRASSGETLGRISARGITF